MNKHKQSRVTNDNLYLESWKLFLPLQLGEDRPEGADPVLQVGRHLRLERGVGGQVLLVSLGEPEQIS